MAQYDTVIKNGMIVDGRRMPRFKGDLGIKDGVIMAIGRVDASQGERVIDAQGRVVAPGFIDLHTHYDAQIFWDPYCSISGWHGVTSVAIGNCGFGFAPVAEDMRERAMLSMTRNEAIGLAAMKAGMPWDWETFPEFLDSVERTPKAVNVLPFMPLTPLMTWVMGLERAKAGEMPTDEEHAEMGRLLDEAMDRGACGFTMQRLTPESGASVQRDYDGTPMVTDVMHHETCLELARVLGRRNEGLMQMTAATADMGEAFANYEELAAVSGRPILYNVLLIMKDMPEAHRGMIEWLDGCRERGNRVYAQAVTNDAGFTFTFEDFNLFDDQDVWRECMLGTPEERLAKFRDPKRRAELCAVEHFSGTQPIDTAIVTGPQNAETKPFQDLTLGQVAELQGKTPIEAMIDIAVADDLKTEFFIGGVNTAPSEGLQEVVDYPWAMPGVSDGGAHTKFFTGGTYPTEFLMRCVRDEGMCSLEEAHWKLSALPAMAAGFRNRGVLEEGAPADLVIYDLERLELEGPEVAHDLPGGDWRRVRRARGYAYVLVNGVVTIEDDRETGQTQAGKLLRHGGEG
jgi:N-acyl-D-aspartate/D-glutamate deacylase